MYRPEDIALPRSFQAAANSLPPHVRWLWDERDAGRAVKHTPQLFACTEREAREAIALNYGLISFIDDCVGRVVARLQSLGLADNTIVIFTSDHGDYMGDHQLMLKGPIHYRGLIQTPFLWRDPAGPRGRRSSAFAGTIDIAPTILARAGVPGFNGIQGKNLLPLMHGETAALYSDMLIEEEGQRLGLGLPAARGCAASSPGATGSAFMTASLGASCTIAKPIRTNRSISGTRRIMPRSAPSPRCVSPAR